METLGVLRGLSNKRKYVYKPMLIYLILFFCIYCIFDLGCFFRLPMGETIVKLNKKENYTKSQKSKVN